MSKAFKETTMLEKYTVPVLMAIFVICFTLFGFFIKQDCDIDRVFLWCRLHPFSLGDFIGCAMWYAGCVFISGILPIRLYNPENSTKWNLISFVGMVLSIVLIWNT